MSVGKVNNDTNRKLTAKYNVKAVSQFLLIKNGQEMKRHIGRMTLNQLQDFYPF
ncbi:thioredoxin family protein [Croceivirga radicis]|uniref:thioredoxin family protein n=1 Tax=Croceivirga radicis TaxID=1929488 RepID=UPI0009DB33FB